jgi:hypothetical protein
MSADKLWQPGFRVYFWTFTFAAVHSDWEAMRMFSAFLNHLRKTIGGDWSGVRVAELHPGGHGVHFHALLDRRLDVHIVRRVGRCYGIGRIHVEVAHGEESVKYLAKYLSKQREGPLCESGRNARRWASFGPIQGTRVSDLVNESPQWVFRREHGFTFLGFRVEPLLNRCWDYGESTFKSAWYAARRGEVETVCQVANGMLESNGVGLLVQPARRALIRQPF